MKEVKVRGITIGSGRPKICVPIVEKTEDEIISTAREYMMHQPDLIEWRVDFYEGFRETEKVLIILEHLREVLEDCPLLFTFRTKAEGGEADIRSEDYVSLLCTAIQSQAVDLVDAEWMLGDEVTGTIVKAAKGNGVYTVFSNHDFHKTPEKAVIIERLCRMQDAGAHIAKMAVMPQSMSDVVALLDATQTMKEEKANIPIITMAMGAKGTISRAAGEFFGSAVTFGMIGKVSAPGQMPIEELRQVLDILHKTQD